LTVIQNISEFEIKPVFFNFIQGVSAVNEEDDGIIDQNIWKKKQKSVLSSKFVSFFHWLMRIPFLFHRNFLSFLQNIDFNHR
jgi:hypothetical protein